MAKKTVTLDQLARLVRSGFRSSTTKQDLENLASSTKRDIESLAVSTKRDIENLAIAVKHGFNETATKQQLRLVVDNVDLLRADVHDVKVTLGPLVHHVATMEREVGDLKKRVDRVERKVGIGR